MKKIIALLFAVVCFGLVSCSNDDSSLYDGDLIDGQYIYYGSKYAILIGTVYKYGWSSDTFCDPGYISISDKGSYVFNQSQNIEYIQQDGYSGWSYENGLTVLCVPKSEKRFIAKIIANTSDIDLPAEMEFNLHKQNY